MLLAVEVVADSAALRAVPLSPLTKINLLKPIGSYLTELATEHPSGRCLCQDETYIAAYRNKYS